MRASPTRPIAAWLPLLLLLISGCFDELPWDKVEDTALPDLDGDGYSVMRGDCDDQDPERHPEAQEVCDELNVDEDCDDLADDDDPEGASGTTTWFQDRDGDGYASDDDPGRERCDPDETWNILVQGDCDDEDPERHPGAVEVCDELGIDEDCDGLVDDQDDSLDPDSAQTWYPDEDGDSYGDPDAAIRACLQPEGTLTDDSDCDDSDPAVNPDGQEVCDEEDRDEDCDGWADDVDPSVDRETRSTWYADADHDGYADPDSPTEACDAPAWHWDLSLATDCDDSDPAVNPDEQEVCDELDVDEDCDGLRDDQDPSVDPGGTAAWYDDADGDGYGDPSTEQLACDPSGSQVADDSDCDDRDAEVNPAATELCNGLDDNCDGVEDEDSAADAITWYLDADGDGHGVATHTVVACEQPSGYAALDDDCDDGDPAVSPSATELCNGVDDDCDGLVDDDDSELGDATTWYSDGDGDGWGEPGSASVSCIQPSGAIAQGGDCDDADGSINPGATELCDGVDNDCDGEADEDDAADASSWLADTDGDGWGDAGAARQACTQPSGHVAWASDTDCDDGDADQHPGADELCNGEDDDCDGSTDEDDAVDVTTWYADVDTDGYGDPGSSDVDCEQPTGFVADISEADCDDTDPSQHPGADEICNGEDDDCDGVTDEDDALDVLTWYRDADGDGYGDATTAELDCTQPSGTVAASASSDCDDTDPAQHPGADEYCNGEDDDCDGVTDEDDAVDVTTWYLDSDEDDYGDPTVREIDCERPSASHITTAGDCDDADDTVHPAADEYCNGVDDDCDGVTDEDGALDVLTWYADIDGDGYGDPGSSDVDCEQPSGYLADASDCDDLDRDQHPGADEYCNGEDDDCDGVTDEDDALDAATWYRDGDGDGYGEAASTAPACSQPSGYVPDATDCDDSRADVSPGATERCDDEDVDEDCDGSADDADSSTDPASMRTWYRDVDGDGVGSSSYGTEGPRCDPSAGYVAEDGDCDESNTAIHALHDEICDGLDNDCDAGTSEDGVLSIGATAYGSLAEAVAAAGSGDEVVLCDGSFAANVTTSAPLTLRSLHGAASTTLHGGGAGAIITMGDDLWLEGILFTAGAGSSGGAIDGSIGGGATLAISDCVFDGNQATHGGAIYASQLDMSIANTELVDNVASDDGGGLFAAQGTDLDLNSVTIHGNQASRGGGAWFEEQVVLGGSFADNIGDEGGGVYLRGGSLEAATIEENLASVSGGGAQLDQAASLLGGTVQLNLAPSGGGVALAGDSCSLDVAGDGSGVLVTLNEATVYGGGAVVFAVDGTTLISATLSDNIATYGGGLYAQRGDHLSATDLAVTGNATSNTGGGLYLLDIPNIGFADLVLSSNSTGSSGGGGLIDGITGALLFTGAIITDNDAGSLGGGLYLRDVADADITGLLLERNIGQGREGGGFYLDSGVVLYASGSFGSGADDNSPDDIGLAGRGYSFTSSADCNSDHLSCTGS